VHRGLILGYHRVAERDWDPYDITVSPRRFSEQLGALRRLARPVALAEMTAEFPPGAVALTFDDGYADNALQALPHLARHEVPATVFVATDYVDGRFWWDELATRFAPGRELPDSLEIRIGASTLRRRAVPDEAEPRRALVLEAYRLLRQAAEDDRRRALDSLREAVPDRDDGPRPLREAELRELASHRGVEVGAHTRSHASLGELPRERQEAEIVGSKEWLERRLGGRSVSSFSYPNGSTSAEARAILERHGFRRACTSHEDVVTAGSDPYRLPRFWIPDWSGKRFSRWLRRWLGAPRGREV
jgi:peptidoglycan/xylan/chitin deacetylase (PgdA/CDA1 family)